MVDHQKAEGKKNNSYHHQKVNMNMTDRRKINGIQKSMEECIQSY